MPGLTGAQLSLLQAGELEFGKANGVKDGLGPVFNGVSCVACHSAPASGGSSDIFATRIGAITGGQYNNLITVGGPTIQVAGIGPVPGAVFAGEVVPPQATIVAHRRTNPLFGLGLVDAVPDSTFQMLAMQQQSVPVLAGQPNMVRNLRTGALGVGRFGWKAQTANLFDFAVEAYKDEIGVTTAGYTVPGAGPGMVFPFYPADDGRLVSQENPPQGNTLLLRFDPVASPNEPNDSDTIQFVNFISGLAPPPPGPTNAQTQTGQTLFSQIGCAFCHVPALTTGASPIAALSNTTFHPYSDFLLHDMGTLGDGTVAGLAGGTQMRTAPLWGLRALPSYLHDGRAATVAEAIQMHAGQGLSAAKQFNSLPAASQNALLSFLNSL